MVWFDRSGRRLGEAGPARDYLSVALSPDGRWIAASELGESAHVLVIDAERGTAASRSGWPRRDLVARWIADRPGARLR